ncbi:Uncharacterised protein [Nocardia africana]|uniref:Uncharacterized protein n=3 Tax=Nocardiaceae TaxID=85025 RepID=A0A378X5L5_9NOCA|nr:Uncharacterised protein [Nocardia africana]
MPSPSMKNLTPETAAFVADSIEQMLSHQRLLADQLGASRAVSHVAAGRPWAQAPVPRIVLPPAELTLIVHTAAVAKRWRANSQIACLVDPTLAEQLMTAASDALPTGIFRQLPYANPLIVFAAPIPCRTTDDRAARLLGFFVHGLKDLNTDNAAFCDIHTEADTLGVTTVLELTDGGPGGHELNRLAIPLDADRLTLPEYVAHAARNHPMDLLTALSATEESVRSCLQTVLRPVLGALLYLCSADADIDDQRNTDASTADPARRASKKRRARRRTAFVPVGWRIGARMRRAAAAAQAGRPATPGAGTGRTQPPRQRRSHFKVVWTGVGRRIPRTVFVLPYFIHKHQIGLAATESTLVPTSPRRRRTKRSRDRHTPRRDR